MLNFIHNFTCQVGKDQKGLITLLVKVWVLSDSGNRNANWCNLYAA